MADDPANKKEGNEPLEDSTPSDEELPPPWAAAMARQVVEAVKQAGRVSKGTSPGTSGESHTHAHTLLGRAELSYVVTCRAVRRFKYSMYVPCRGTARCLSGRKLAALAKLSEADKNASMGTEAEAGDGAKLAKTDTAVSSSPTIVVAPGIPALPKKLAQKILNGEYVDFAELPPAKGRAKPSSLDWEGQVLLVQSTDLYATKKLIPDLATWVQCFSIYATVIWSQSPERLPDPAGIRGFHSEVQSEIQVALMGRV